MTRHADDADDARVSRAGRSGSALALAAFLFLLALPHAAFAERQPFVPPDDPPHYPPARQYDLQHLRLDLDFDLEKQTVSGTATNTLVPLLPGLDHLVFHAAELQIRRVRLAGSEQDLPFTTDPAERSLTVQLGHAYGPADRLDVAVEYSARPRTGLYFVRPDKAYPEKKPQAYSQGETDLNRHWYPSWDHPGDRTTTELYGTVAKPYQVIGNGKLIETLDRPDGRRTFHWKMDVPHSTYLTSVVVGDFVRIDDSWKGIPVESYVPRGMESLAPRSFDRTADMIDYFSRITDRPYPYPKYAQTTVYDYMWGGMENISATTLTVRTLHDERAELDYSSEGLVSHEVAHQWFGDLVTCADWSHVWLNEGFADYFELLYRGHAGGELEEAQKLDEYRRTYIAEDRDAYRRPLVTYRYRDSSQLFDRHSYEKGALVLHMARFLMGEEGWWKGVRDYLARFAGKTVVSADLQTTFEQASGASLTALFEQYVYGAGLPELALRWDYRPETGLIHLEVRQTQTLTPETGLFSFPVEIAIVGEPGTEQRVTQVTVQPLAIQDLYLPSAGRPRTVVFDPKGWILKTVDFEKPASEWIVQLEAAAPLAAQLEAIEALGELGDGDAVAALARVLREAPFHGQRSAAAKALGKVGTDEALAALRAGLGDGSSRVRTAVLLALQHFPEHPELIPVLRKALEGDESYTARASAATSLGKFEDRKAEVAPILVRALSQESYQDRVRGAVIDALTDIGAPQAYEEALRFSRYGAPMEARDEAVASLASIAASAEKRNDPKIRQQVRKTLEGYLSDPNYLFRGDVFEALGDLGDPEAIPALERQGRAEGDVEQRLNVEDAVKAIRDKTAAAGKDDLELRERVQQLEREVEVLKGRLEAPTPP